MMLKKTLPLSVQEKLDGVIGLNTMAWKTFQAHIIHFVNQYRKAKLEAKEMSNNLMTQLCKSQLGEIVRNKQEEKEKKKEKEAATKQAALMVNPQPTSPPVTQPYQNNPPMQTMTSFTPRYRMTRPPQYGRGRGRGCWACGDLRHFRRDCPHVQFLWGDRVERAEQQGQTLGPRGPRGPQTTTQMSPPLPATQQSGWSDTWKGQNQPNQRHDQLPPPIQSGQWEGPSEGQNPNY